MMMRMRMRMMRMMRMIDDNDVCYKDKIPGDILLLKLETTHNTTV